MGGRFDLFVVFAEMRTGSNFLEANLNALDGVACHGEAFNPHFIGYPESGAILGVDQAARDADPDALLAAIRAQAGVLGGFRYFHDHDPRVLGPCLDDPRVAKIILTRNPAESYVSWQIAQQTGQWKLTDVKARKEGRAMFDADAFERHVSALQAFQVMLLRRLQVSGQTAFYLGYEDLQNVEVMNGLAAFLGVPARLAGLDTALKVQNPAPLSEKVANFEEIQAALAGLDRFNLTRTPNFEPRRGPAVPSYVAAAQAPLLYVPIKGGVCGAIEDWLAAIDGVERGALRRKLSQKGLRHWKRKHPGHRSFTVLQHPVARAHHAFCTHILATGPGAYPQIRETLRKRYKLPIPAGSVDAAWSLAAHRRAFAAFLAFLKGNLNGQTAIRVDAAWCSQTQALQGVAEFVTPDLVLREAELAEELPGLARRTGCACPELALPPPAGGPFSLEQVYTDEIEQAARAAYQRDYMMFGFGPWRAAAG